VKPCLSRASGYKIIISVMEERGHADIEMSPTVSG
jgi:hypothetical protein